VWTSWRTATQQALYGEGGFYRVHAPSSQFRTSVHASPWFAVALLELLAQVDDDLGHPQQLDLVDVGAGRAELLSTMLELAPSDLRARLRPTAVELADRPPGCPPAITWTAAPPESVTGLLIANEWLDNVPVDVVQQTRQGPRVVLVDAAIGAERLGPAPDPADQAWLDRWWPMTARAQRAELGRPRDEAWAGLVGRLRAGVAVAVDYAHSAGDRPPFGSLTAYRDGRPVAPWPDGTCDLTSHVALDACAAAGKAAGARDTVLTSQREALLGLGLTGRRPELGLASSDPDRYVQLLRRASEEAELVDTAGLGGFGWLVQSVGLSLPARLLSCHHDG
jgi:SAM-dependent MidA family methyltransferase